MNLFKKKKILVTHGGGFHVDDLMSTSALYLLNEGRVRIKRIGREEVVDIADYIYDVGGVYDPNNNRFDHHQKEALARENGITFSSFGLIWKKYGVEICDGNEAVAERIDKRIVTTVDALDNGIQVWYPVFDGIKPYEFSDYLMSENLTWSEKDSKDVDKNFYKLTKRVAKILKREIVVAKDDIKGEEIVKRNYEEGEDKRVIFIEQNIPRYIYQDVLSSLPEPLFAIIPTSDKKWKVEAIRKGNFSLESRKLFPAEWRGISVQNELEKLTGIPGMFFCHRDGFLSSCLSKEAAISLVKKVLDN